MIWLDSTEKNIKILGIKGRKTKC